VSEGGKRIQIELAARPAEVVHKYVEAWNARVSDIAAIVKDNLASLTGRQREERFITEIWGLMNSNLEMRFGENWYGFLYESMQLNRFDCDCSAFFVYDVAKLVGVNVEMIAVLKHVLIKTDNFFFETIKGEYHPIGQIHNYYREHQVLADWMIPSITYEHLGMAYARKGMHKESIAASSRAIDLNPDNPLAYYNRAYSYRKTNQLDKALKDLTTAIRLNSDFADAYDNRGLLYIEMGEMALGRRDIEWARTMRGGRFF